MTRYAVYAVPGVLGAADDPRAVRLRDAVAAWYDHEQYRDLTAGPRRYGFHATLKAPFRLPAGCPAQHLVGAATEFAAGQPPITLPALRVSSLDAFRALLPTGDDSGVNGLAEAAVRHFEPLRAPLTADDRARRRPDRLSPAQRDLLDQWGYPYVLDEFRCHLTLTDPVPDDRAAEVDAALADHFAESTGVDVPLHAIVISVEPTPGAAFEIFSIHPLTPREAL